MWTAVWAAVTVRWLARIEHHSLILSRKVMTKCDFCFDLLDQGFAPACVSACQMRVLHFGDIEELRNTYGKVDDIFPLPNPELTSPAIVFSPHPDAVTR